MIKKRKRKRKENKKKEETEIEKRKEKRGKKALKAEKACSAETYLVSADWKWLETLWKFSETSKLLWINLRQRICSPMR